jgi:hypothetical protein
MLPVTISWPRDCAFLLDTLRYLASLEKAFMIPLGLLSLVGRIKKIADHPVRTHRYPRVELYGSFEVCNPFLISAGQEEPSNGVIRRWKIGILAQYSLVQGKRCFTAI